MNMYICYSGLSCIFNLNILLSLIYFVFSHNTFYITNKCMNAGKFRSRMWPDYKPASTGIPNQILQWSLSTSSVIMCTTCHVLPYQPNNKPLALNITPNYTLTCNALIHRSDLWQIWGNKSNALFKIPKFVHDSLLKGCIVQNWDF